MTSAGGLSTCIGRRNIRPACCCRAPPLACAAAAQVAAANGFDRAVSFDMGGTSTDVCLIDGGLPEPAPSLVVGGYPVRLPALAIHTVGAGGGSIAGVDDGGAVTVGPRSAGAIPGPACYGHGGDQATVTDADLLLGRIPADAELPGIGRLDPRAASAAMERAGVTATDVVAVVDAAMTEAVRVVSVAQGVDPRDCALVAFGGAGPLHACAIAEALGMAAVVVPARAGVFSAVGLRRRADPARPRPFHRSGRRPGGGSGRSWCERGTALAGRRVHHVVRLSLRRPEPRAAGRLDRGLPRRPPTTQRIPPRRCVGGGRRRPGAGRARLADRSGHVRRCGAVPVTGPAIVAEEDTTVWVPPGWHGAPGRMARSCCVVRPPDQARGRRAQNGRAGSPRTA